MPELNKIDITFTLSKIEILKFSYENILDVNNYSKDNIQLQVNIGTFFNIPDKLLGVDTNIDLFTDVSKSIKICELKTRIQFLILNFNDIFTVEEDKLHYPIEILPNFLGLALSTTRGILFTKLEGTLLHDVYLPIVNPSIFIPNLNQEKK